jgi:hypothetical protein
MKGYVASNLGHRLMDGRPGSNPMRWDGMTDDGLS